MSSQLTSEFLEKLSTSNIKPFQLNLYSNSILGLCKDYYVINSHQYLFNNEVDYKLPITDQKSSGRCWLFATLNLIRTVAHQNFTDKNSDVNMEIGDLEFSQSYLYFFDKLERYHRNLRYFLEINKMDEKTKIPYLVKLYNDPLGDGGQFDMAMALVKKYGIVPKKVMPDSFHAKATANMNKFLTEQLKNDFMILTKTDMSNIDSTIENMVSYIYECLVGFLGKPPVTFDYVFKTKSEIKILENLTPLKMLELTGFNCDDYISVVNDPRQNHPYEKYFQVEFLGNVFDKHVGWINLPINRMKYLVQNSISNKDVVWFGCDVGAHSDKDTGIHHPNINNIKLIMENNFVMTKEERLLTYTSLPSHAMVIVGFHKEKNKVIRYKIENSWGKSSGDNGFMLMTDEWFDEYVFQIVVNKKYLSEGELNCLKEEPLHIDMWDPLGTLA